MKLLRIDSSPRDKSVTGQLTEAFADAWKRRSPGGEIVSRDLTSPAIPPTSLPWIAAARIDPARRSSSEREALALSDELIAEVEAASVILIGAPLYNSSTPAPLKAWIDQIVRPGRTVQYSPQGPKGLLGGSKVIVVTSRSGEYSGDASRSGLHDQDSYVRTNLGFVGLTDVTFVHVEKGFHKRETEGFHGQTLNAITELVHFAPWFSVDKLRAMVESGCNQS